MFDDSLTGPEGLRDADDAAVVTAVAGWARVEAAAAARRLAAVAELADRRRATAEEGVTALWACDAWDAAAAEVGAAQNIGHRSASGQMHQAIALRDRLPRVGKLFMSGEMSARVATSIAWRTQLIEEAETLAIVDAELVAKATRWGPLSAVKLEQATDAIVERYDPGALLRFRGAAKSRDVQFGDRDDETGMTSVWGRLLATDATVLIRRLDAMARSVCADDPRTMGERRSDALGTLGVGGDVLACACGTPDCAAAVRDARADAIVIHVVAHASSVEQQPASKTSRRKPKRAEVREESEVEETTPTDALDAQLSSADDAKPAAVIAGGGLVPAPLLAELVRLGAPVRRLSAADALCAEPGYRPSIELQRFVRSRDLTCRFPGCATPAERCDIDHTVPYPVGPTHPSNLKCLCRKNHLLKTFWAGPGGWIDRQLPDGSVVWTSPTGATYVTHPGSRIYFPDWDVGTSELPEAAPVGVAVGDRGLTMPTRRRTRAQQRAQRIRAERARNDPFLTPPPPF